MVVKGLNRLEEHKFIVEAKKAAKVKPKAKNPADTSYITGKQYNM